MYDIENKKSYFLSQKLIIINLYVVSQQSIQANQLSYYIDKNLCVTELKISINARYILPV